MGARTIGSHLTTLLKECYQRPHRLCHSQYQPYSTDTLNAKSDGTQSPNIAVLGGGITGLTSAYLLAHELPSARITLYETTERLGGWLQTNEVDTGKGRVLFELGPRSIRPSGDASGWATLDLIRRLGLQNDVLLTPKTAPAAMNRFLYYPDHLVKMPGPGQYLPDIVSRVLSEPIFHGVPFGVIGELFRPPRHAAIEDESVGSFYRRRYGPALVNNILSAVLHGIYAGDVDQLSVRSLMPAVWYREKSSGSLTRSILADMRQRKRLVPKQDLDFMHSINMDWHDRDGKMLEGLTKFNQITSSSVYTFRAGLEQLASVLEDELAAASNVEIKRNTIAEPDCLSEEHGKQKVLIRLNGNAGGGVQYDHVISTCFPKAATQNSGVKPPIKATVMVVNLHYRSESLLPVNGFGYLLPRSVSVSENPERALGVVFDSDATKGHDSATGTKLTVMIGGHWWHGWPEYPDEHEGLKMARSVVERHLGIRDEPDAWKATLQKDCIPQYHVGHTENLNKLSAWLMDKFKGRLRVAGASFHGVSVNDCVKSGYMAARGVASDRRETGLEKLEPEYVYFPQTVE